MSRDCVGEVLAGSFLGLDAWTVLVISRRAVDISASGPLAVPTSDVEFHSDFPSPTPFLSFPPFILLPPTPIPLSEAQTGRWAVYGTSAVRRNAFCPSIMFLCTLRGTCAWRRTKVHSNGRIAAAGYHTCLIFKTSP